MARRKLAEPAKVVVKNPVAPDIVPQVAYNQGAQNDIPQRTDRVVVVETQGVGSSGIKVYGGYFSEEYLINKLYGTLAADEYDKMRRSDANVRMLLSSVKSPIKAANWEIEPADDSAAAREQADFVEHCLFRGMDQPFEKYKNEALTAVEFGYAPFEVTHKIVTGHPKWGTYIGLKTLGWRSPRSILRWQLRPTDGSIEYVQQLITGDLQRYVQIPGEYLIVVSIEREGDNYEGISLLRSIYGAWLRKQMYLKLMAIGMERNAVGLPLVEVPDGRESTPQYLNMISSLQNLTSHQNAYLAIPAGWKVTFEKNNFEPTACKTAIDFENTEMTRGFLANFLELGMTSSGSGRALSEDLSLFFLGAIQHIADECAAPLNRKIIPDIVDMKYGRQERYPLARVTGISDKAGLELANALNKLTTGQVIQPDDVMEASVRKRYGLPAKSDKGVRIVQAPKSMQQGDNVVTTDHPEEVEEKERNVENAELTARGRKAVKPSNFAIPEKRRYPIHDVAHARNALARVAQYGTAAEQAQVRAAVYRKYPQLRRAKASESRTRRVRLARAKADAEPAPARLIWNTTGDNTCDDCAAMDGTVWDEDDPSLPELPLHPNCGCELAEYSGPID